VSRSYSMTSFLRQLAALGDAPYEPPFATVRDIEQICSACWGKMGSREKGDLWKSLWARWGDGGDMPGHYERVFERLTPERTSVRETILVSRIETEAQQADSWAVKTPPDPGTPQAPRRDRCGIDAHMGCMGRGEPGRRRYRP
jgi:hypothetical protein